jgi:hypothetical protein
MIRLVEFEFDAGNRSLVAYDVDESECSGEAFEEIVRCAVEFHQSDENHDMSASVDETIEKFLRKFHVRYQITKLDVITLNMYS